MLKLFKNLKAKEWIFIIINVGLIVVQVWLELKIPDYIKNISTDLQTGAGSRSIWINGGYMLSCALGVTALAVIGTFISSKIASAFSARVRLKVFDKVNSFSMNEIKKFSTASLITRSTNDITQIQMVISMGMQVIFKAPIMAIWAIIKISSKSWQWSVSTAVAVAILIITVAIMILLVFPKFKIVQKLTDNLNRETRENLTGVRVVRAFNAENYMKNKFEATNSTLTKTQLFNGRILSIMGPAMTIIMSGLPLSIYWIGGFIIQNTPSIIDKIGLFGDMMSFSSYALQIVSSFMMLIVIFIILPRASVSAKRINEVLDAENSIQFGQILDSENIGTIEFKNVSFKYPNAEDYILKNIDFDIKKGETVAFIGSTGSGKSTLINLVPRFYDVTEGEIILDGKNIKDFSKDAINNKIGYISQHATLFTGTVLSNVAFGEIYQHKVSEEDVNDAIEIAQAKSFIEEMDGQINAEISQGGKNISGGQKQRLSIARALSRKPEILIFDDTFSALDFKTDKMLRKALNKNFKNTTKLIVASRIGTIKNADKIIVLDSGEIVGIGTHKELINSCEIYKEIALSQLSKGEI